MRNRNATVIRGHRFGGYARERSARGRSARAASGSAHVAPTWERRSLPYHSEIDARNNTFRIQHPSSPARRPRRTPRRAAPRRAAPRRVCKVLIATAGHAVAVDDGVLGVGVAAQPRDLGLAQHGFALRGAAMFATSSSCRPRRHSLSSSPATPASHLLLDHHLPETAAWDSRFPRHASAVLKNDSPSSFFFAQVCIHCPVHFKN